MKKLLSFRNYLHQNARFVALATIIVVGLGWLLLYKLRSLTGGLSRAEVDATTVAVGWHGIYDQPLYLPLNLVRSVIFFLDPSHGDLLSRLPNAIFGGMSIVTFAWLIRLWHGTRTAIFAGLLFATSAWVLHVSRLASFDVLYLWTIPTLLLTHVQLHRHSTKAVVFYGSMLTWGLLLFIPGAVWLVLANAFLQRKSIANGWQHFAARKQRALYVLAGIGWLPLLIVALSRAGNLRTWLGIPDTITDPAGLLKQFVGVFVHMFLRGPQYAEVWLDRAPLLDVFTLIMCILGLYFYAKHRQVARTRLLGTFFAIGIILVALGGPVGLSLLVPILYIAAATGMTFLLHDWLRVFPNNPLARTLGIGLVVAAVALACLYNTRAYFVAWPHNLVTQATFQYHR
ncbi:MAG: hypothetical protein JWO35_673 [Candidatus Saccharibacteria bacterium]|nr:hypothetical protein [Candidatus Saccharibacteria bacterium]